MLKKTIISSFKKSLGSKLYTCSLSPSLYTVNRAFFSTKDKPKSASPAVTKNEQDENAERLHQELIISREELTKLIEKRKAEVAEISEEKTIPGAALFTLAALTTPLVLGSGVLNYIVLIDPSYLSQLPFYYQSLVKYSAIHLAFMTGIHWGFAVSEHDCQEDPVNSSSAVRRKFQFGFVTMAMGFLLTGLLTYGYEKFSADWKMGFVGGLMALHLLLFGAECLDHKKYKIPNWFLRVKLVSSMASVFSLCGVMYVISQHEEKLIVRHDPFKKFLPDRSEIVKA
mmetsp:Transcript_30290/g.34953  ORF Transcript_30290/g.34953 Transcript_30290/m.34953 type:complete len:284 (+) Transcript_30290:31-882(+)